LGTGGTAEFQNIDPSCSALGGVEMRMLSSTRTSHKPDRNVANGNNSKLAMILITEYFKLLMSFARPITG
jgi:hypothetical protein